MNESVEIDGAQVIAAMTPPESKAGFNRAQPVVRGVNGVVVQVRTYTSDGRVEGSRLSDEELRGLIAAGQAIELTQPSHLRPGAAIWVLRRGLPRRDRALQDARCVGVLVHAPILGPDDSWLCVVDESSAQAGVLRDRWRDEAVAQAKQFARNGDWKRAETEAELAHQFARGLEPEVLALLSLAHEKCDRVKRAQGVLAMARNSRGADFASEVETALRGLRVEFGGDASDRKTKLLHELLAAHFQRCPNVTRYLGEPRTARLDAA